MSLNTEQLTTLAEATHGTVDDRIMRDMARELLAARNLIAAFDAWVGKMVDPIALQEEQRIALNAAGMARKTYEETVK